MTVLALRFACPVGLQIEEFWLFDGDISSRTLYAKLDAGGVSSS